jgi:hypothetical protein
LTYYFYGPDGNYQSATQAAATDWNDMSDLSVSATTEGWEKIGVFTGAYGSGAFVSRTTICDLSGCNSYDESYTYAEIDYNTDEMSGFSWSTKRAVAGHEFGHAFSLAHVLTCGHLMYPYVGSCLGAYPQPHDIDGVNVRY